MNLSHLLLIRSVGIWKAASIGWPGSFEKHLGTEQVLTMASFLAFFGSVFQFLKRKINIHCESFPTLWAWSTENQYGYQSKSQYTIFSSILHDNNSIACLIGSPSVVSQCWNKWTVYLSGIKGRKHGPISRRSWSNKWIISRMRIDALNIFRIRL